MDTKKIYISLKSYIPFLLILFALSFSYSCDTIISQVSELPEEQDDEANNPNDPTSSAFKMPGIEFTNGSYSLDTPFTITQRNLTLDWSLISNNGDPITDNSNYTFQYRYAHSSESLSDQAFVDIGTEQSLQISNLRETLGSEIYDFEIQATYNTESVSRDTTFSGQFYVDAFQNRGFLFNPDVQRLSSGDFAGTYIVEVFLDEIQETDDLKAFSLSIDYSSSFLSVGEQSIEIMDSQDSYLYREGAEIISFVELSPNRITIDLGVAGTNLQPYSGGGKILEIYMTPAQSFSATTVSISSTSVLKNSVGTEIEIGAYDSIQLRQ